MKRAAIYARFSTEHQSEKSIEDQVRLCQQRVQQQGYKSVGVFQDEARSGTSMLGRDGLERLMQHAKSGNFDVLILKP